MKLNNMEGMYSYNDSNFNNPTVASLNSYYVKQFYLTKENAMDIAYYKRFLENAIKRFRTSITYDNYKAYLINLGMDRCQIHSNITFELEDISIEMHHNMLTIFDIAIIICEHILNTVGYISSFDLVELIKKEHINNRVQLVMLSSTAHQVYHNNDMFFIHPDMCFGKWWEFLEIYNKGITPDIGNKIISYLNRAIQESGTNTNNLFILRDTVANWSHLNECCVKK